MWESLVEKLHIEGSADTYGWIVPRCARRPIFVLLWIWGQQHFLSVRGVCVGMSRETSATNTRLAKINGQPTYAEITKGGD